MTKVNVGDLFECEIVESKQINEHNNHLYIAREVSDNEMINSDFVLYVGSTPFGLCKGDHVKALCLNTLQDQFKVHTVASAIAEFN